MHARTEVVKVVVGVVFWLIGTAYVTILLLFPFLPVRQTEMTWELLLAPVGIVAILTFYGWHLIEKFGEFWTPRRLIRASLTFLEIVFLTTMLLRSANGFLAPISLPYFGLVVITTTTTTPLGLVGIAFLLSKEKK